ncbi:MAG TPA: nuclease-related domain-containing protein [Jatrophihabitantaceae bacterium]|nr:nuclease-related domain-containing protein [Jatrophihabitantaceae bacterium]
MSAWDRGAAGEELLGSRLDALTDFGVRLLHDRRPAGERANIDHIAIGPRGVFVIDAKRYRGRPEPRERSGGTALIVDGRDRSKLVDGVRKQGESIQVALTSNGWPGVSVRGMLCFVVADWSPASEAFVVNEADVLWPKMACELVVASGTLEQQAIEELHRLLAASFPIA